MRSCVSLITAASLLLHVWLGCCAHHGHAEDGPKSHAGCHEAAMAGDSPGSEAPDHDCDEPDCSFLALAKQTLTKAPFTTAALPALDADQAASSRLLCQAQLDASRVLPRPVRPHLLYQVFRN
jgi:hypothetical protein